MKDALPGTMEIKVNVPDDAIVGALISGVESGIYYWVKVPSVEFLGLPGVIPTGSSWVKVIEGDDISSYFGPLQDGHMILIEVEESTGKEKKHQIGKKEIAKALQLMAEKWPQHFKDVVKESGDAVTGDVLIQLACFGDIKYG